MPDRSPTAVTYEGLPIGSGGAHGLGRTSRRAAYQATIAFLETCTMPIGTVEHSFTVHQVPDLPPALDLERRLQNRFGRGRILIMDKDEVDDALEFLEEIHPQPTNQWGMAPIWFRCTARYLLVDPETGRPLRGQTDELFARVGYNNQLQLTLHNQAALRIEFCIPEADEQVLGRLLPWLQQNLPCRLSPKHWRAWRPTKSRTLTPRVLDVSRFLGTAG